MKKWLYECVKVLRPKNGGPFGITLDCLFDDEQIYRKIKESGIINRALVAELYHIPEDLIANIVFFDLVLGFKTVFVRQISSGTSFDRDVYGAQQHASPIELLVEVQGLAYLLRLSRK